jgi:RNA polymerase sigma-70 factor, ECF subfamily
MLPFILIVAMTVLETSAATAGPGLPSFRSIFEQHAPYVWRTLRRLGVRPSDIDDACQEVFVVVHRRGGSFDGTSTVKTWIYGICVRVASDFRRKAHVRREMVTDQPPDAGTGSTLQEDRRAAVEALDRLLGCLDDDKLAVFVLYEIEQLTMKEVAEAVQCPLQTAYSRLHAARERVTSMASDPQPRRGS